MSDSRAPYVQVLGEAIVLQGVAVLEAAYLVALGVRETSRRDGITPSAAMRELVDGLELAAERIRTAAMSVRGHADVRDMADSALSDTTEPIASEEAATMLGLGTRQVRRLAASLGGRLVAGRWTFDRGAVESYAADRRAGAA